MSERQKFYFLIIDIIGVSKKMKVTVAPEYVDDKIVPSRQTASK